MDEGTVTHTIGTVSADDAQAARSRTPGGYSMTSSRSKPPPPLTEEVTEISELEPAEDRPTETPVHRDQTGPHPHSASAQASSPPAKQSSPGAKEIARLKPESPPAPVAERSLLVELATRAERLKVEDPVGSARARLELGLLAEWDRQDRDEAKKQYEAARALVPAMAAALLRVRRLVTQKAGAGAQGTSAERGEALPILQEELSLADNDDLRADLHATRARAFENLNQSAQARNAYLEALKFQKNSPAALRGLEAVLRRELAHGKKERAPELAAHLARLADTYAQGTPNARGEPDSDVPLCAWLHVERAEILENEIKDTKQALAALERGAELEPNPGPVRAALLRHLYRHDGGAALGDALRVEGEREADNARASRMFYAAARFAADRGHNEAEASRLLTLADGRAPQGSPTRTRVLDELIVLYDAESNFAKVAEVRQKKLALVTHPAEVAYEYSKLSDAYHRLGRPDVAADMAGRALQHDPTSQPTRDKLDQALQRLGRHAERVRSYLLEANSDRPIAQRIAACRKAAEISIRHLNQRVQAIETLRAAWVLEPGNGGLFDDLSALLRASPLSTPADVQRAEARIDLYVQAEALERDRDRKIALLEKVLSIYEDEIGDPKRAIEVVDKILALEPGRRSAILALSRNARRANDNERLARALSDEAKITDDHGLRSRLLLEGAEVLERAGDRDRALQLVDRAMTSRPNDRDVLRARVGLLRRAGRLDEARKGLTQLVQHNPADAFDTWLEIADLDESQRRAQNDAVTAYREAARLRPDHPLPRASLVRLLRSTKSWDKLVESLGALADVETDPRNLLNIQFMRAEVEELCLEKDSAAIDSLEKADAEARNALAKDDVPYDPAVLESLERILVRRASVDPSDASTAALTRLYAKWLERKPPAALDHSLRIALATALARPSPQQSVDVLEALVGVVPGHVPALRRLEHLHRERASHAALTATLYAEASVFTSRVARGGALWELVSMEERVGPSTTLDALSRLTREFPRDYAALDAVMRVAARLVTGVGVPHPALLAARGQLLLALRARRELTADALSKAAFYLEEAMLSEHADGDAEARAALDAYSEALALWPDSFVAARGLDRMATKLGDAKGIVKSQLALARLVESPIVRAGYLSRAAELNLTHLRDDRQALDLYEQALAYDPENRVAAVAVGKLLKGDPRRLIERARAALDRAREREQVAVLGSQIAVATLELGESQEERPDYGPAIQAMQRVIAGAPDDIAPQFLLARLYQAQKAWAEARDTILKIVQSTAESKPRIAGFFQLADIFEGPLAEPLRAREMLAAVLQLDPKNKVALERFLVLAQKQGDMELVRSTLERLAENETDLGARAEYFMRLSDACREAGDAAGMTRALADAIVSSPADLRPWAHLARAFRTETTDGAAAYARSIEQIIELARARRRPLEARWLLTLGLVEVNVLKRATEGVAHLQSAAAMGNVPEMRAALGQGMLAVGRNKEAVIVLRDLLTAEGDTMLRLAEPSQYGVARGATVAATGTVLSATLSCLDAALATDGRADERIAVEEVRACLGEAPIDRVKALRARRVEGDVPYANVYGGTEITRALLPEAHSPVIDAALAISPIAAKVLRFEISSLGVGSRERLGQRDGHPTWNLAFRLARALGIPEFELYLTTSWQGAMRAYPGDPPALVGHVSFAELSEAEQMFGLGRLLLRVAVGLAWLDEVPVETGDGLILSAMRCVLPQFGVGEVGPGRDHGAQAVAGGMQRAIGRKQRRILEELAPSMTAGYDFRAVSIAVRRSEYRTGYILSGNLVAAIDYLRMFDGEIARSAENPRLLLQHPVTNELIRYALSTEAYAERRRVGTG